MQDDRRVIAIADDREAIGRRILADLPDWFGIPEATENYIKAAGRLPMLGWRDGNGDVAGFVSLDRTSEATVDMHVIGVLASHHRQGVGSALVDAAADWARGQGASLLAVKTLGASYDDPFYERTRLFYQAMGFLPVEEFKTLWGPDNPCLLMIKPL
ncbi:MAG: GNAT family N-acetyltransferase [Pseudomonadota bacterium]